MRPLGGGATCAVAAWSDGAATATLRVWASGTYRLELSTACARQSASRRVAFMPCLTLPNIITPNGDGYNDRFEVRGLTGDWLLRVYSRWSQDVFSIAAYRNDWGETAAGTYYYLLQRPADAATYRGWLEVVR